MGNIFIQFPDKCVTYETFVQDLSATIMRMMAESAQDTEFVSQRKAYAIFGRANVERWRTEGLIEPMERPGKLEYRTADLRLLQRKNRNKK